MATRTSPSTRCWTTPLSIWLVANVAITSGSRKKIPIPAARVTPSIRAIALRPSSTPSSDAASDADRTSQRVPTTSVSYRTTSPRTNGSLAQRLPWKPVSSRSVSQTISPSGLRKATAIASRPRIRTPSIRACPPYV